MGKTREVKRILYIFAALSVILTGCPAPRVLPDEPVIEFTSFILDEKTDELGNLTLTGELRFDFQDGDGDIGLDIAYDTIDIPDSIMYNLFLTIHEKVDGRYVEVDTSGMETPPYYRVPPLDREGQNKTLSGEIMVDIQYFIIQYDTIKYTFFLMDRAFHRSNVDTTTEIVFTDWID